MMSYIQEFISESIKSYPRWIGTEMENYHLLDQKKKGDLGELIVQEYMEKCREDTRLWGFQSGKEEFMCTDRNPYKWINSPYARDIETWNNPKEYTGLTEFINGNIHTT